MVDKTVYSVGWQVAVGTLEAAPEASTVAEAAAGPAAKAEFKTEASSGQVLYNFHVALGNACHLQRLLCMS